MRIEAWQSYALVFQAFVPALVWHWSRELEHCSAFKMPHDLRSCTPGLEASRAAAVHPSWLHSSSSRPHFAGSQLLMSTPNNLSIVMPALHTCRPASCTPHGAMYCMCDAPNAACMLLRRCWGSSLRRCRVQIRALHSMYMPCMHLTVGELACSWESRPEKPWAWACGAPQSQ